MCVYFKENVWGESGWVSEYIFGFSSTERLNVSREGAWLWYEG